MGYSLGNLLLPSDTITGIATYYCKGEKINVEVLARLFSTRQKQNAMAYILEDILQKKHISHPSWVMIKFLSPPPTSLGKKGHWTASNNALVIAQVRAVGCDELEYLVEHIIYCILTFHNFHFFPKWHPKSL